MSSILLVEDELPILQMYEASFLRAGFTVFTATNGKQALSLAETELPQLILLDLRMPGMSGEEVLTRIRASEWGADIHVAVLTNLSRSEAPKALQFLNVSRYIIKAHHTPSQVVSIAKEILHIG